MYTNLWSVCLKVRVREKKRIKVSFSLDNFFSLPIIFQFLCIHQSHIKSKRKSIGQMRMDDGSQRDMSDIAQERERDVKALRNSSWIIWRREMMLSEWELLVFDMESFAPFPSHHDFPFVCDQKIIIKLELNKVMMRKRKQAFKFEAREFFFLFLITSLLSYINNFYHSGFLAQNGGGFASLASTAANVVYLSFFLFKK